jgi:hypothetical protein
MVSFLNWTTLVEPNDNCNVLFNKKIQQNYKKVETFGKKAKHDQKVSLL